MDFYIHLLIAAISSGTPLLLAVLGGILCERSGVIHLGAEGIMLMGAAMTAVVFLRTDSMLFALAAALTVSAILGLLHAFLTVTLNSNQIVSGLAITLFGEGLSAYLGKPVASQPLSVSVPKISLPGLESVPVMGKVLASMDVFVWLSLVLACLVHLYLYKTSWGLHLRAVGDGPATADAMGIPVNANRYLHVVAGSMFMGLAGVCLILSHSPSWMEGMTAGRGWIAVALVIFAGWRPLRALACAYFFGGLDALGFRIQLTGSSIPSYFLKMLPYIITIAVLMIAGWRGRNTHSGQPEALGIPYVREQRF